MKSMITVHSDHGVQADDSGSAWSSGGMRRASKARVAVSTMALAVLSGVAVSQFGHADPTSQIFSPSAMVGARVPKQPASVPGFTDLVAAVKPAVVSVRVKADAPANTESRAVPEESKPFRGTPFERFFREFPRNDDQGNNNEAQHRFVQGLGSGFFVSADGYIVTNNHVVDHAVNVSIITDAGETLAATVVGTDKNSDLALIKVQGRSDFPFVKLAQQPTRIGEWVVAMGNPFGLGGTVTAGIVSAEGRDIGSGPYDDYIQIDAPVNRGNSGGPTFNLNGEVIGVNTAIYSPSGGSVGIAFDIPASTIASVIPQLQSTGHVTRGWLGVQIQKVTKEIAEGLGLKTAQGALVAEPQPDSPAAKSGLKSGDVITSLDGQDVKDPHDLARRVSSLLPGKTIELGVVRDGSPQTVRLVLGTLKDAPVRNASAVRKNSDHLEKFGLTVAPASAVGNSTDKGIVVVEVDPNGSAAEAGFASGDVILKAGNTAVNKLNDLVDALANSRSAGRKATLVLVKRGQSELFVAIPENTG